MIDWGQALLIFVLGIGTVFSVLIILWLILSLMKVVFYKAEQSNESAKPTGENIPAPVSAKCDRKMSTPKKVASAPPTDENELLALLSGVIAAHSGNTNLRVKSYKKI